ncbi:MAG: formyltransferase family protein [Chloroflexi bacterium]|nr:formyltransferase family protein [Chloroflexota bacterium]
MTLYRIGWFSTGRGKGSRDLLTVVHDAIQRGELKTEIAFVFSNRETGQAEGSDLFLHMVESYRLPLVSFSSRHFCSRLRTESLSQWRLEYDRQVMQRLESFSPDLCVLAGYMLVLGSEMCQKYKMINLHPAAPGGSTGTWQEVIWKLIESGADTTGAMMHLVTPELDKGPPVTFCQFPIRGDPFDESWKAIKGRSVVQIKRDEGENNSLFKLVRQHGLARELPLIVTTIKAFSQGRVRIENRQVVDASGRPITAYDLTSEIDEVVGRRPSA